MINKSLIPTIIYSIVSVCTLLYTSKLNVNVIQFYNHVLIPEVLLITNYKGFDWILDNFH